jgi:ankyrin repeat protein
MWAAAEGHAAVVRELVHAGAVANARTDGGFTALMFAARAGDVESARELLRAGALLTDVDARKRNALLIAAASRHVAMVTLLLEQGADPNAADASGMTALHEAVWGNFDNVTMIQLLLAHSANPNAKTTRTPPPHLLHSFYGDIQYRTEASLKGATPFALAAAQGDANAMRALAAGGADTTIRLDNGTTPLMLAAGMGWGLELSGVTSSHALNALEAALELGGDVNARNAGGRTAMHGAANNDFDVGIRFLGQRGGDISARDNDGWTPLWTALHAQAGSSVLEQPAAIRALRELGAHEDAPIAADPR